MGNVKEEGDNEEGRVQDGAEQWPVLSQGGIVGVPHVVHGKGGQLDEELDDEADGVDEVGLEV